MRKPTVNFIIDSASLVAFIFLISTGFLIYFVLPAGSGHLSIWGMNRHAWGDIHFWIAISFLVMMATHFVLHWDWITNMIKGKSKIDSQKKKRIIASIIAFLIVVILALAPFFSAIESTR